MIRLSVLFLLTALAASPAAAERVADLGTQIPGPSGKTWRDLFRQIFFDLRQEAQPGGGTNDVIHGQLSLRPIDKQAFGGACLDAPLRIEYIEFAEVRLSDQPRLVVGITTDGGACFGALALFDGAGDGKLLDIVDIKQDANYAFGPGFVRSLGPYGQLVVADSFHTGTGVSPNNNLLILATENKLSLIGNIDAQSERDCHQTVAEDRYIAIAPDFGPFDRITGYVKRTVQRLATDCQTGQGDPVVTIARTDWRWDAASRAYRKAKP